MKLGLKKLASYIPPKFYKNYRNDKFTKNNIKVYFSYLMTEDRKYEIKLGEIFCPCGGKIEKQQIYKDKGKGKKIKNTCNCCKRTFQIKKKDIKNEMLKRIRNIYEAEAEYLAS